MYTYSTCLLLPSATNSLYLESISHNISTEALKSSRLFDVYPCHVSLLNAFGMSHVATSLFSFALTIEVIIVDSVITLRLENSLFPSIDVVD